MAYQFHAWARKSIASLITTPDDLGAGSAPADSRMRIPLEVEVSGNTVNKQFTIAAPGDINGIRQEIIVRTDPRPNSGDFEPNYFPSIEFYDEDFPWRYTPAAPVGENQCQLRPWLMLIVLTEDEFVKTKRSVPLSSIVVKKAEGLPSHTELHLWAHVHSNFGDPDTPLEDLIGSLRSKSETDPDGLFSRIICPRKLEHDVLYHAFLVPTFEAGRLAGLDLPSDTTPAQQSAWTETTIEIELPVYYRGQFRTGANADFETLLRMMEARPDLDPRVGIQELDCSQPGYIKVGQQGEVPPPSPPVLGMCGAVKQLTTIPVKLEDPVKDQPFVQEVKKHLDMVIQSENPDKDPVVTIPFYGYYYAKTIDDTTPDFLPELNGWPHAINRDPRNRAAAGLGTLVVQAQQEKLMQSAWAQLPQINEINRRIKQLQLIMQVNERLLQSTFQKQTAATGKILAMARPAAARIKETNAINTIYQTITESKIPDGSVSSGFRRLSRPNGSISRKLNNISTFSLQSVFSKVNQPAVSKDIETIPVTWFNNFTETQPAKTLFTAVPGTTFMKATAKPATKPKPGTIDTTGKPDTGSIINTGNITLSDSANAQSVFLKTEQVLAIGIPEEVSTIQIAATFQNTVLDSLHPVKTLLPRFRASLPGLPKPPESREDVLPVMAHPDFPEAVYQYLADINQDYIVPNLSLVPPNTIALMEPNYEFIHSFLVGINHEMSRELLWREYPTDQRGTYFRQFWDPGGNKSQSSLEQSQSKQSYKDIKPITDWGINTVLDDFFNISNPLPNKPLVLLLRGDLFKKYPNTVIFAQKATVKDNKLVLDDSNPQLNFKFPLFSGNLAPDVRLLGFDLSAAQAKGDISQLAGAGTQDNAGWFFVLAEVPGEPRFGMDITYAAPPNGEKNTWDNLSLEDFKLGELFVSEKDAPLLTHGNWPNDDNLEKWGRSSADMAGILLQKPAMMAIHGEELLKSFTI